MPGLAKFTAASDVSDGIDHTPIKQTDTVRIEIHSDRMAVASIAVEQQGSGAVTRRITVIDERNRNAHAVLRCGVQPLADILRGIVAAEDGLLFAKHAFSRAQIVVKDGARGDEGFVLETHESCIKLGIVSQ